MDEELKLFLEDVTDQIEFLEEGLVSLEKGGDPQAIHTLFRAAHTLKGISATFGAQKMQELTHQMETVFQKIRDEGRAAHQELITILLTCADVLKTLKIDIEEQRESSLDVKAIIEQLLRAEEPGKETTQREKEASDIPSWFADMDEEEIRLFLEDVNEQLEYIESGLVSLEEKKDPEVIQTLFHAAHTLKGISATFGAQKMQELSYQMESVFRKARDENKEIHPDFVSMFLSCADTLKKLKNDIETRKDSRVDIQASLALLRSFEMDEQKTKSMTEEKPHAETQKQKSLNVFLKLKPDTEMPSVRLTILLQETRNHGEVMNIYPQEDALSKENYFSVSFELHTKIDESTLKNRLQAFPEVEDVSVQAQKIVRKEDAALQEKKADDISLKGKKTIRLDMERVDALMNITSELVIEKNRLLQISQLLMNEEFEERPEIKALFETRDQLDKKISFLQDEMLKVRMISLDALFKKLPRVVRDAAVKAEKEAQFIITGATVELDKTVIDELSDPLIHLLRNAVDHGIKAQGEILLAARQAEGYVFIEVSDNGQGINIEKVKQKALERKIMDEEQLKKLSEKEILDLIFAPGFSTKENVSALSGRGVGLDVVKENIKKIHGSVDVQTQPGKGTKFILKIPLTLAIIKSLLVLASGQKFAIPLSSVHEIVQVSKEDVQTVKTKEAILLRGNVLPLFSLSGILEISEDSEDNGDDRFRKVVVVTYQEKKVGFVIDTLLGEQEIVVYSLGKFVGEVPGISGATIDDKGRVALILDVPSLVASTLTA